MMREELEGPAKHAKDAKFRREQKRSGWIFWERDRKGVFDFSEFIFVWFACFAGNSGLGYEAT